MPAGDGEDRPDRMQVALVKMGLPPRIGLDRIDQGFSHSTI